MDEALSRKEKWEKYAKEVDTETVSKRASFEFTVENFFNLSGEKKTGRLLDAGCGFGEIDILVAQRSDFEITACDISEKCVEIAKQKAYLSGAGNKIKFEVADVYRLPYEDNYFDIAVSFGYTSAATYKGAQTEIARVLKPGGMLICDFVNPLSLYKIIYLPKRLRKFIKEEGKYYNILTAKSISRHFAKNNLRFVSQRFFNTYPPIDFLPISFLIFFEKSIGRVLGRVMGRVRIVCFEKEK
ncbi:MAG: hypothetical protein A3B96_01320 [Candidatus Spechtbacteria bacterium RIFCSPHIGHO2_02_FULL_43_15b]|uniref:Methyltransferase domain-containing protein n=1 Tax=Candidatus Spechtbacteria bacterium RIFCSPHIGHO2_01_FULL_43_30 TaxID=1802158 RepID=A0A1G2H4F8_9BACT|nr:MAG: hypothetical protein A2827_03720 [Candidatus Spechtbacteria bacterium RIFCSPHIGHO2_01_FULL_43_30]OGZ59052.1 MAG: hypothetical protein A3B96_01320 [Candidatus Spechtbacteria bacterium RIFCSPHIGHO2_02_FULL_43_15b]